MILIEFFLTNDSDLEGDSIRGHLVVLHSDELTGGYRRVSRRMSSSVSCFSFTIQLKAGNKEMTVLYRSTAIKNSHQHCCTMLQACVKSISTKINNLYQFKFVF